MRPGGVGIGRNGRLSWCTGNRTNIQIEVHMTFTENVCLPLFVHDVKVLDGDCDCHIAGR